MTLGFCDIGLFILTLESSAASRPQWTKFGPFLGEGGLLPFPIYFFIFYFPPFLHSTLYV